MSTAVAAPNLTLAKPNTSNAARWTGRVLTGIAIAFLAFDAVGKLLVLQPVVEGTQQLGFPVSSIFGIGLALAVCTVLHLVPRTSIFGAVLLTGYLGGAVAANVRVGNPMASHTLFPVYFAVILWLGLYLRDSRARALIAPRG